MDRQTDKQRDRQIDTDRQTDRQTHRQKDIQTNRWTERTDRRTISLFHLDSTLSYGNCASHRLDKQSLQYASVRLQVRQGTKITNLFSYLFSVQSASLSSLQNIFFLFTWPAAMQMYWSRSNCYLRKSSTPTGLVWDTNMADVTKC